MTEYRFIEPLDVLYLRGNRLFDGAGDDSSAVMPPWPSVFAGALRSRLLVDAGVDLQAFAHGKAALPEGYAAALGTPAAPGAFALGPVVLARRRGEQLERFYPPPADLQVTQIEGQGLQVHQLRPAKLDSGLACSGQTAQLPLLRIAAAAKPASGYWLTSTGWQRYLNNDRLTSEHLISSCELWRLERRLGIGMDIAARRAGDGALYTSEVVALRPGVGFWLGVNGVAANLLSASGMLRLGGDGRAAALAPQPPAPVIEADWQRIERDRRFRIVLLSPGLFPEGWRLPGLDQENRWHISGASARLVCAAVPRAVVISGWDVANHHPKPAQRFAPAGAVYWLEELEGDPAALRKLANSGLWGLDNDNHDPQRRAEGFNHFAVANA